MTIRLNKLIAQRGVASRREAERLIEEHLVTVNGEVADHPGQPVDPEFDHVKVRGKRLPEQPQLVYVALFKPAGMVTTSDDPEGRKTIFDLLNGTRYHGVVEPVGRLDYGSEGLLLMTNDGDLAHKLTHPKFHVPKTYMVKVAGVFDERKAGRLRKGLTLDDGRTAPAVIRITESRQRNTWIQMTIREGRNRIVRRMMEAVGHRVLRLKRTSYGDVTLGAMERGQYRTLTAEEVKLLREMVGGEGKLRFEKELERQSAWSKRQKKRAAQGDTAVRARPRTGARKGRPQARKKRATTRPGGKRRR